jgi:hypothetical protein
LSVIARPYRFAKTGSMEPVATRLHIRFDASLMSYLTRQRSASPATRADADALRSQAPMTTRLTRAIGLAGLASFVLIIVAALVARPLWSAPRTTASAVQVAAYAYDDRGRTIASLFIYCLAMGLFLCFAAGLWTWLRQSEPAPQPLAAAFAFGAVALVVLILAGFVPGGVLTYRPQAPAVAQALRDMTFGLLALSGIPTAVCLGAYAALVLRRGRLPQWTAWLAVLGAVAHVFIAASFVSQGGFLSLEGSVIIWVPGTFFAWILATSLVLLRTRPEVDQRASFSSLVD